MSYHLNQELRNSKPIAELPPEPVEMAPVEPVVEQANEPDPVEEVQVQQAQEVQPVSPPTPNESFRELREKAKRLERERDEAIRENQQYKTHQPTTPQAQEEDELHIGNDDLAEGKHIKKVEQRYKKLEQEFQQYKQENAALTAEQRLATEIPGFASIVNKENLDALKDADPDAYEVIAKSGANLYARGKMAYKAIKQAGFLVEDTYVQDRLTAQKNAAKPRPLTSVSPQQGDTPLSRANAFANGLTDELKAQLRREMEDARRAM